MLWKKRKSAGARGDQRAVHTLNLDDLKENEKHELYKAMSEHAQMARHAGHVEHAYAIDTVATSASCR